MNKILCISMIAVVSGACGSENIDAPREELPSGGDFVARVELFPEMMIWDESEGALSYNVYALETEVGAEGIDAEFVYFEGTQFTNATNPFDLTGIDECGKQNWRFVTAVYADGEGKIPTGLIGYAYECDI